MCLGGRNDGILEPQNNTFQVAGHEKACFKKGGAGHGGACLYCQHSGVVDLSKLKVSLFYIVNSRTVRKTTLREERKTSSSLEIK